MAKTLLRGENGWMLPESSTPWRGAHGVSTANELLGHDSVPSPRGYGNDEDKRDACGARPTRRPIVFKSRPLTSQGLERPNGARLGVAGRLANSGKSLEEASASVRHGGGIGHEQVRPATSPGLGDPPGSPRSRRRGRGTQVSERSCLRSLHLSYALERACRVCVSSCATTCMHACRQAGRRLPRMGQDALCMKQEENSH